MSTANQLPSDLKDEIALRRYLDSLMQRIQLLEQKIKELEESKK